MKLLGNQLKGMHLKGAKSKGMKLKGNESESEWSVSVFFDVSVYVFM